MTESSRKSFRLSHPLVKFLLRFVLAYGVLLALFSANEIRFAWSGGFLAFAKTVRSTVAHQGQVAYFRQTEDGRTLPLWVDIQIIDKRMVEKAKKEGKVQGGQVQVKAKVFTLDLWNFSILPFIFLVSLILASPVSWKQRLIALLAGGLLLHLFFFLKLWIKLLDQILRTDWLSIFQPTDFWVSRIVDVNYLLSSIGITMVIPLFIWLVVTFRKEDWIRYQGQLPGFSSK